MPRFKKPTEQRWKSNNMSGRSSFNIPIPIDYNPSIITIPNIPVNYNSYPPIITTNSIPITHNFRRPEERVTVRIPLIQQQLCYPPIPQPVYTPSRSIYTPPQPIYTTPQPVYTPPQLVYTPPQPVYSIYTGNDDN